MSKYLKHHLEGKPLPKDWWNYRTNPITGYPIDDVKDEEWQIKKSLLAKEYVAKFKQY